MRCFLGLFFLYTISNNVIAQDLRTLLFELPDVIFKKVETDRDSSIIYELNVKQPLDHGDPAKGYFYQKVFLRHSGFYKPTVMATEGYGCAKTRVYELTRLLDANQIQIEHRFFGESMPDSLDYNYLNLEQATADLHKINQLFRRIYSGSWVSTGISKGGATTIFYRYFYPDDVDVSVPYVAPINTEFEEKRIYDFLDNVGSEECREKIKAFQVRLLKNRNEILPLLKFYGIGAGLTFSYLTLEEAFEFAVLEYPFSFWQWGHDCKDIPSYEMSIQKSLEHFIEVSEIGFFSDKSMEKYASHYYQSATEMGYYGYEIDEFKGLLRALPTNKNPHAAFVPDKMNVRFDKKLLDDVNKWLETDGSRFIYIYGELDTWSASAVPPSNRVESIWFFLKGKHHGSARIRNMTIEEKQKLTHYLEQWLEVDIK
ncbi:MAG: hypothetical protein MI975_06120 [Cytophagales bacterium]|nr:hypothetical protein [Cytophagales bacterium]